MNLFTILVAIAISIHMKNISIYIALIFLIACQSTPKKQLSPSDLLLSSETSLVSPKLLTTEEVLSDVELLSYALSHGYGGRKYVPKKLLNSSLEELGKIQGSMTPTELRDRIDLILWSLPDNHLKARVNGKHTHARKEALSPISIGKNAISRLDKIWEVRIDKRNDKKILYISITKFPSRKDAVWTGFIEKVKRNIENTDMTIVDFRGNGGGDDFFGYQLAEVFFGGKFDHPIRTQYISQTPETIAIAASGIRLRGLRLKASGKPVPPYFNDLYNKQMVTYHQALSGKIPSEKISNDLIGNYKFDSRKGYNKAIYILFDRGCGSSCESSIDAFEPHPNVTKVGVNTIGMIHFGNIGALLLPNSKIHVQIPTHHNEYFDKRFIEKIGIEPDIKVSPGQDAYSFLKRKFFQ